MVIVKGDEEEEEEEEEEEVEARHYDSRQKDLQLFSNF